MTAQTGFILVASVPPARARRTRRPRFARWAKETFSDPSLIVGVGVFGAGLARIRTGVFLKCIDFALVALGAGILVLELTGNAF